MLGFVNSRKERKGIGGHVFHRKKRRNKIIYGILGLVAFLLLNLVFYLMTKV